jgi:hypothetical protein
MGDCIRSGALWSIVVSFFGLVAHILVKSQFSVDLALIGLFLQVIWILGIWAKNLVRKDV